MTRKEFSGFAAGPVGAAVTAASAGFSQTPSSPGGTVTYDTYGAGIGVRFSNALNSQAVGRCLAVAANTRMGFNIGVQFPTGPDVNNVAFATFRTAVPGASASWHFNTDGDLVMYEAPGGSGRFWTLLLRSSPNWVAGARYRIKGVATGNSAGGGTGTVAAQLFTEANPDTAIATLPANDPNMIQALLTGADFGVVSANNTAGRNMLLGVPVLDDGATTAPADPTGAVALIPATQEALPVAEAVLGSWTASGGPNSGVLADNSDSTYLISPAVTSTEQVTGRIRFQASVARTSGQIVIRADKTDTGPATIPVRVYANATTTTVLETWTIMPTTTPTNYSRTLTQATIDALNADTSVDGTVVFLELGART